MCLHSVHQQGLHRASLIPRHESSNFVTQHYDVIRELGEGNFGHASLVRERHTRALRVCKTVKYAGMAPYVVALVRHEVELLAAVDHPHIVRLFEYADDKVNGELILILEYASGGGCDLLLEKNEGGRAPRPVKEDTIARLVCQLLSAVGHCHSRGIVHRDIKPENMMLSKSVSNRASECKLIDFGLSIYAGSADQPLRDFLGTPPYMAPEIVGSNWARSMCSDVYTAKADIWSVGCSAIELLSCQAPFGRPQDNGGSAEPVFRQISSQTSGGESFEVVEINLETSDWWHGRSAEAQDFVRWLLEPDPKCRPSASEALEHPWVRSHWEAQVGLTAEMVRSMSSYASASALAQRCLLLVAARADFPDRERIGAIFLAMDTDGTGEISKKALSDAVSGVGYWWSPAEVDVDELFYAADMDRSGGLSFSQFAAACLYAHYESTPGADLALDSFELLDSDRDGYVTPDNLRILRAADEDDVAFTKICTRLRGSRDKPFQMREWRGCFRGKLQDSNDSETVNVFEKGAFGLARKLGIFDASSFFLCTSARRSMSGDGEDELFMDDPSSATIKYDSAFPGR